jgi:hypothetical protein
MTGSRCVARFVYSEESVQCQFFATDRSVAKTVCVLKQSKTDSSIIMSFDVNGTMIETSLSNDAAPGTYPFLPQTLVFMTVREMALY